MRALRRSNGCASVVTMLLERGASLNARGVTTGRTALDKAREKGWGEIAHALEAAGCRSGDRHAEQVPPT